MISEAEFFEGIPEGTVQAPSDLLVESYLLRPSRFPKHEKHRTSRRLTRTVTSVTWGKEGEACYSARETCHYFVFGKR